MAGLLFFLSCAGTQDTDIAKKKTGFWHPKKASQGPNQ